MGSYSYLRPVQGVICDVQIWYVTAGVLFISELHMTFTSNDMNEHINTWTY